MAQPASGSAAGDNTAPKNTFAGFPLQVLHDKKRRGERIAMISLYDAPSAMLACDAGTDILLVGDSMGNVILGFENTLSVTIDAIEHHTGAVARGIKQSTRPTVPFIADLPFASYQGSVKDAVRDAARLLRAGAHGVKVEGAGKSVLKAVRRFGEAGIPTFAHIGFTPQSVLQFHNVVQARTTEGARKLLDDALLLQEAGCIGVVLEVVPREVAAVLTSTLKMPTIGIGAGAGCDGQVLIWHDLAGVNPQMPLRFVKRFAQAHQMLAQAAQDYVREVQNGTFPTAEHSWQMNAEELAKWQAGESGE